MEMGGVTILAADWAGKGTHLLMRVAQVSCTRHPGMVCSRNLTQVVQSTGGDVPLPGSVTSAARPGHGRTGRATWEWRVDTPAHPSSFRCSTPAHRRTQVPPARIHRQPRTCRACRALRGRNTSARGLCGEETRATILAAKNARRLAWVSPRSSARVCARS